eukprot:COSAG02_NODE_11248_length_1761_cov_0.995788_1_plen_70_part_10
MLRRFKVPITKQQFKPILRLIDPDQSKSLELDEWLSFMSMSMTLGIAIVLGLQNPIDINQLADKSARDD